MNSELGRGIESVDKTGVYDVADALIAGWKRTEQRSWSMALEALHVCHTQIEYDSQHGGERRSWSRLVDYLSI